MLKLAVKLLAAWVVAWGLSHSPVANAGVIDPAFNSGSCCNSSMRGYWFQTPTDFTIDAIWLNSNNGLSSSFTLQVLKFNAPPPEFSSVTTDFVSLGYFTNAAGALTVNYSFNANDYIGLLAVDNNLNSTPYSNQRLQNINGFSVSLTRLLRQGQAINQGVSSEASSNNIGAIGFSYNTQRNSVPVSGSLMLLFVGATLLAFARRRPA